MGLTTISYNEKAKAEINAQLANFLGDRVPIRSLCFSELSLEHRVSDDLILITASAIKDFVIPYIDPHCKYLIAKRTINPKKMSLLFSIPPGAEVLAVNLFYESSKEFVNELETIGINHVAFYPYNPKEAPAKSFQYAVTPGEPDLVAERIPFVIDVGNRLISIMTIAEILFHFTGGANCDNLINSRYIRVFVQLLMELSERDKSNEILCAQMKELISNFEDGVILTDLNRNIMFYNKMAASIMKTDTLIGRSLDEVLPPLNQSDPFEATFVQLNDRTVHLSFNEVNLSGNDKTEMVILKDLTKIRSIDEQYRNHSRYLGHNAKYTFSNIIYSSRIMSQLISKANNLAKIDSTILITGESGTGKELFAQSIHNASRRKDYPFLAINCAALSESLLESELFGYEEGAFTGAKKGGKKGLFELAHKGTVFLDEIGDAPYAIQKKLLRVLQEKEIMRVSGDRIIAVDVRIIAATNKDFRKLVAEGIFREDLFYRLNVLPLHIPPLRDRKEDIEILLNFFLNRYASLQSQKIPKVNHELADILADYSWPGNIRELENIAEYIVAISPVSTNLKADIVELLSKSTGRASGPEIDDAFMAAPPAIRGEAVTILRIIAEARKEEILLGRSGIQERLLQKGLTLSEQQIKTRIELLKKYHFVRTVIGRGTVLTPRGEEYLQSI